MTSDQNFEIGLSEAIEYVRDEISRSLARSPTAEVRFRPGEIKLDLEIAFANSQRGEGRLRVWVLTMGGSRTKSVTNTHRISMSLLPVMPNDDQLLSSEDTSQMLPRGEP